MFVSIAPVTLLMPRLLGGQRPERAPITRAVVTVTMAVTVSISLDGVGEEEVTINACSDRGHFAINQGARTIRPL